MSAPTNMAHRFSHFHLIEGIDMNGREIAEIQTLAREGKQISRIKDENYPQYEYWDIYNAVYGDGGRSARGVKKMISTRLNTLTGATKKERNEIIEEVHDLVWHLYDSLKSSQKKLDAIRKALED